MLHVTFGSVLTSPALKDRLFAGLAQNEETYYDALERHFIRHLSPIARSSLMRYVFSTTDTTVYRFPTHVNELVLDRSESTVTEVFIVVLEPGEAPPLHKHPDTEQVFYMLQGEGELRVGARRRGALPGQAGRRGAHPAGHVAQDRQRRQRRYPLCQRRRLPRRHGPRTNRRGTTTCVAICAAKGWDFASVKRAAT